MSLFHHLDQVTYRVSGDLPVEFLDLFTGLFLPRRDLPDDFLQLALQFLDTGFDRRLIVLFHPFEIVRPDHLPVGVQRREGETGLGVQKSDIVRSRLLRKFMQRGIAPTGEFPLQLLDPRLVFLRLKSRGYRAAEVLDELLHVVTQPDRAACRKLQGVRPVRLGEVVHVAPVRRYRALGGLLPKDAPYDVVLADSRRPECKDVGAVTADVHPVLQRNQRPILADRLLRTPPARPWSRSRGPMDHTRCRAGPVEAGQGQASGHRRTSGPGSCVRAALASSQVHSGRTTVMIPVTPPTPFPRNLPWHRPP